MGTNVNDPQDIMIKSEYFKLPNYTDYSVEDLKYQMLSRINGMPIEAKAKKQLISNIKNFPDNPTLEKLEELKKAALVLDIIQKTVFDYSSEVLKGGHVMIEDEGKLYEALVEKGLVKERHSSHHNDKRIAGKYDVSLQAGEIFKEFLVGKTNDGKTWFQLEAHSLGGIKNFVAHIIDYIKYKITGKNIGQYSLSAHTDNNPIKVARDEARKHVHAIKEKYGVKLETFEKNQKVLDKKYMKIAIKSSGKHR